MFASSIQILEQLKQVLLQLPKDCYDRPCNLLSHASIGQHTRHIIEFYQCLLAGYETAAVFYDRRKRDQRIELDVHFAIDRLPRIQNALERPQRRLLIYYELNGRLTKLKSNYHRELMYNLEHTIHHLALIKIGIEQLTDIVLPDSFGVAPSTLQYRTQDQNVQ
ncbi:DinB family protein [Flavobacteriaceae bacterium 3-367]